MNSELIINEIKKNNLKGYTLEDVNHTFDFLDYIGYEQLQSDIFMGKFDISNNEQVIEMSDLIKEYSDLFSLGLNEQDYITISLIIYNISKRIRKPFKDEIKVEEIIKRLDHQEIRRRIYCGSFINQDSKVYEDLYKDIKGVLNLLTGEAPSYRIKEELKKVIQYAIKNLIKVIDEIMEYCKSTNEKLYSEIITGTLDTDDDKELMEIVKLVDDYNKEKKMIYEDDDLVAFSYEIRMIIEKSKGEEYERF